MPEPDKTRIRAFEDPAAFWNWLQFHHACEPEAWLKIFKKGSGQKTITWNEAVVEALCWGWIDGVKKPLDDQAFLQRFTPRRKGSNWSKRNREHVERLIAEGRIQEPGLVHVRAAQSDGKPPTIRPARWRCLMTSWQHWRNVLKPKLFSKR
jgi:uncharacterized protein YdeI (YjbR/CyaY-like superfamily)